MSRSVVGRWTAVGLEQHQPQQPRLRGDYRFVRLAATTALELACSAMVVAKKRTKSHTLPPWDWSDGRDLRCTDLYTSNDLWPSPHGQASQLIMLRSGPAKTGRTADDRHRSSISGPKASVVARGSSSR